MRTFSVVKEQHGWAVRMGEQMCTPYWSKDLAVREANCLADALRLHGECVEVIIEGADPGEPPRPIRGTSTARLQAILRGQRAAEQ
jgi:hypothetical protein